MQSIFLILSCNKKLQALLLQYTIQHFCGNLFDCRTQVFVTLFYFVQVRVIIISSTRLMTAGINLIFYTSLVLHIYSLKKTQISLFFMDRCVYVKKSIIFRLWIRDLIQ